MVFTIINYYFQETHKDLPESLFERMNGDSDSFYRHSMGQVITAIKSCRQKSPNLRYSLQIHSSLVSGITKRSFFNTLFATNQPKTGKIRMPSIGDALLDALRNGFEISINVFNFFIWWVYQLFVQTIHRNIEKILWYAQKVSLEFLSRGFSTEVRQFANELVATAEIWGIQTPFLIGKSNQVRALHFEGQKLKVKISEKLKLKIS